MALTITRIHPSFVWGPFQAAIVEFTGDSSYPTGGEALDDTELDAITGIADDRNSAAEIQFIVSETNVTGHTVSLDRANNKLLYFDADSEVANTTNLSAVTVRALVAWGKTIGP